MLPSPTPPMINNWTLIVEQVHRVPELVWAAFGSISTIVVKWIFDTYTEKKKQTFKAMVLELFNDLTEQLNTKLISTIEQANKIGFENTIEITKITKVQGQIVDQVDHQSVTMEKVLHHVEDHGRRIYKIEHWKNQEDK